MVTRARLDTVRRRTSEAPSWALLTIGIVAASLSAILVRYASDAPPLALSLWRCGAAAAVLAPFARSRPEGRPIRVALPGIAGAFLTVHFGTWITSLSLTPVASAVLLTSTARPKPEIVE
jgi:drug/metabolite transporter (DMT)-like permease